MHTHIYAPVYQGPDPHSCHTTGTQMIAELPHPQCSGSLSESHQHHNNVCVSNMSSDYVMAFTIMMLWDYSWIT